MKRILELGCGPEERRYCSENGDDEIIHADRNPKVLNPRDVSLDHLKDSFPFPDDHFDEAVLRFPENLAILMSQHFWQETVRVLKTDGRFTLEFLYLYEKYHKWRGDSFSQFALTAKVLLARRENYLNQTLLHLGSRKLLRTVLIDVESDTHQEPWASAIERYSHLNHEAVGARVSYVVIPPQPIPKQSRYVHPRFSSLSCNKW